MENMNELFSKMINRVKETSRKLDRTKKIIIGVVIGAAIVSFTVLLCVSHSEPDTLLFANLRQDDCDQVTKKLEEMGYYCKTNETTSIFVKPSERAVIVMKLAQEHLLPKGVGGFRLIDIPSWVDPKREFGAEYMRALCKEIQKHIESLKNIHRASVEIYMPDEGMRGFTSSAVVTVHLAPGYEKLSTKEIMGITFFVSRAVGPRLKQEDVYVKDELGEIISDFDDDFENEKEKYTLIELRKKVEKQVRVRVAKDIRDGLANIFSPDRIQVLRLNMEFGWAKISGTPNDPYLPYSTRQVESTPISKKSTTENENFRGLPWNPEGPASIEVNKTERWLAGGGPYWISRISVVVVIDGIQDLPRKPNGDYDLDPTKALIYKALSQEELEEAKNIVKKVIDFSAKRGDQVAVENIMFDRTSYFVSLREELRKYEQMKMLVRVIIMASVVLLGGFILFKIIRRGA